MPVEGCITSGRRGSTCLCCWKSTCMSRSRMKPCSVPATLCVSCRRLAGGAQRLGWACAGGGCGRRRRRGSSVRPGQGAHAAAAGACGHQALGPAHLSTEVCALHRLEHAQQVLMLRQQSTIFGPYEQSAYPHMSASPDPMCSQRTRTCLQAPLMQLEDIAALAAQMQELW